MKGALPRRSAMRARWRSASSSSSQSRQRTANGRRAQARPGNFFAARIAVAVEAGFQPGDRLVDAAEGLGPHLHQRQLDVFLSVDIRCLHFVQAAASKVCSAPPHARP